MEGRVTIPYAVPMFKCFQYAAAACIAFSDDPNGETQIFNQCTNIGCQRDFLRGWSSPKPAMRGSSLYNFGNILRYSIHLRYAKEYCNAIIHDMLADGKYVYFNNFDDYYLPEKSWYLIKHRPHDGIIFGYDDAEGVYDVLAYDTEWVFRPIRISQDAFEESMIKSLEVGYEALIVGIISRCIPIELDVKGICDKLKKYLDSDLEKYPPEKDGVVEGIITHEYFAKYVEMLMDGRIEHEMMDWRVLRVVWEFRLCMQKRLEAVEQKLGMDNEISSEYAELVRESDRLRMIYAVYHKNQRQALLIPVRDGLRALMERERIILERFIDKAEGVMRDAALEVRE